MIIIRMLNLSKINIKKFTNITKILPKRKIKEMKKMQINRYFSQLEKLMIMELLEKELRP